MSYYEKLKAIKDFGSIDFLKIKHREKNVILRLADESDETVTLLTKWRVKSVTIPAPPATLSLGMQCWIPAPPHAKRRRAVHRIGERCSAAGPASSCTGVRHMRKSLTALTHEQT